MFKLIICLFLVSLLGGTIGAFCNVEGYYWRDYYGDLPEDAVPGGSDVDGNPIYMGQILNMVFLIPAKIYSANSSKAFYEYGGKEHVAIENMKILCSQHPKQFEWIPISNGKLKSLRDKYLIIGGYEPISTTYIGRAYLGEELLVGKVLANTFLSQHDGLYVTKSGSGHRYTEFEILTYVPYA